jgi:ABC-type antimicrobial peptide transport system permease subunit
MAKVIEQSLHGQWLNTVLMGTFAAAALLLASVGLYGVVSYLTSQRRKEFGIRVAIGAKSADVLMLVLKQGLVRAAGGLGVGLVAAAAVTSTLGSMLYGVRSLDWVTYAAVGALLAAVVLLATFVPAWRASHIDPTVALRQD